MTDPYEPVIVGFTCNWCSYRAADLAGTARIAYPPNIRLVRLMCSGRLDPAFVLRAFADGADAVVVSGCWPGECHYQVQNIKALRRFVLLRRVLESLGIESARFQLLWASAAQGNRLAREIARITEEVRALGPLRWPGGAVDPAAFSLPPDPEDAADAEGGTLRGADAAQGQQPAEATA